MQNPTAKQKQTIKEILKTSDFVTTFLDILVNVVVVDILFFFIQKGYIMDLFSWFFISIFFHFWCFDSAQGQNTSSSSCTKKFQCGNLGNLSFPFYKSTQLDCGLCKVDCEAPPNPIIELDGVKYQALEKQEFFIKIKDIILGNLLQNKSCQSFDRNLSLPISPSITYRVNPFLTLFKCNNSQKIHEDVFNSTSYQSYNSCESFILYYNQTINYFHGFPLPTGCSFVQLPKSSSSEAESNDLFDLLTDEVTLGWTVSDECNQCYYRGGKCQTDNTTDKFLCYNTKGKRTFVMVHIKDFGSVL